MNQKYFLSIAIAAATILLSVSTCQNSLGRGVSAFCKTYAPKGDIFDGKKYCDPLYFDNFLNSKERACNNAVSNYITHSENLKASNCNYCRMFQNCMKGRKLLSGSRKWK